MTSFVTINQNNSPDSRVYDQLLFLEKLRSNKFNECETESSFVNSKEFNSIFKKIKREKQKAEDEKKWETFLERRLQEQLSTEKTVTGDFFSVADYNGQNNNFINQSLNFHENETCFQAGTEYPISCLNDSLTYEGINFHDDQENGNNFQNTSGLNDSSSIFFDNELQNGPIITFNEDNFCGRNQNCQNNVMEMYHQCSSFQNEMLNKAHLNEQNICNNDGKTEILNIAEQILNHSNDKVFEKRCECNMMPENNTTGTEETPVFKASSESVGTELQKKEISPSTSNETVHGNLSKTKMTQPQKDGNVINKNNSYITEPEENYCKNVAKKIQDIPGVDNELRKVEDIRIKMTPILANIKIAITKNVNPSLSSDEDLERIKQRTLEFGARFKRNYLYRTNCQVNKLKEMVPSPILISKKSKILLLIQKHTVVHHAVIQALQVIEKQLQTISIFGKTQDLISSFYNCIYDLTLTLKPFYGYLKTQVLDEVEKHLVETIKLLMDLKLEDKFSIRNKSIKQKKTQLKSSVEPPPWMKKSAALARLKFGPPIRVRKRKSNLEPSPKVLEPKLSKDFVIGDQVEKWDQGQEIIKPVNFMMSVKQRPGAELRRANFDPEKTEEPKTMIEIISREGSEVENIVKEIIQTAAFGESNKTFSVADTSITKDKLKKLKLLETSENKEPKNVKLINIKRDDDNHIERITMDSENLSNKDENIVHYDDLLKYRRSFKKYKKSNPLYEKNTLNTVVSMSETFLEETITAVSKEINKMKIADLLGIVETFEVDSSI